MNCKLRWQSELAGAEISQVGEPEPNAPIPIGFDAHEVERLMIYRGAVQAGLFTDALPPKRRHRNPWTRPSPSGPR
jgi:hypothetical protein